MFTWKVVQEFDLEPDQVIARGFPSKDAATKWAAEYSLYYAKRYRRYAFLRFETDTGPETSPPRVPTVYRKDARPWWRRLLNR